ncbi:hypothetical protein Ancab_005839 [Ancistrocladus abbreviatus]
MSGLVIYSCTYHGKDAAIKCPVSQVGTFNGKHLHSINMQLKMFMQISRQESSPRKWHKRGMDAEDLKSWLSKELRKLRSSCARKAFASAVEMKLSYCSPSAAY